MQRRHILFLLALTALLALSAMSGWHFAMGKMVERVVGPLLSLKSAWASWQFLVTALFAAMAASGISALISYWVFVERRSGEKALRKQLNAASLMHKIAVIANEVEDAEQALQISLKKVCRYLEWPAGQIYLPGGGATPALLPTQLWHLEDKDSFKSLRWAAAQSRFEAGSGLPGRAWASGKPEWSSDILKDNDLALSESVEDPGPRSGMAIPVFVNDGIAAVLVLYAARVEEKDPHILKIMATVGTQVGRALERNHAEQHLRAANERLSEEGLAKVKLNEALAEARDAALESEQRYRDLADSNPVGIWQLTPKGKTLFANPAMAALLEIDDQETIRNASCLSLLSHDSLGVLLREFATWSRGERSTCSVKILGKRSGKYRDVEISGAPQLSAEGRVVSFLATVTDISERKQVDKSAWRSAHQDPVTGLPSRQLFGEKLADAAKNAARQDRFFALMLLDIEGLKAINGEHGHPLGDALLRDMANRLGEIVRETDTVARSGDHDFAIILTNLEGTKPVHVLARRIIEQLSRPRTIENRALKPEVNVGISFYALDATDPLALTKMAETALTRAKSDGGSRYHLYDEVLDSAVKAQEVLEDELRLALERGEFLLHYQPQFNLANSEAIGAEVLIRWQHPVRGLLASADWMPAAEAGGLMVPIGEWALRQACAQGKAWQSAGLAALPLAVNISADQFRDEAFTLKVDTALKDSELDAPCLALEISESMAADGLEQVAAKLLHLKDLGMAITLDGFGTGYLSLADLKRFPIQRLKIGAPFVRDLTADNDAAAITEAAIKLGHSFGLSVIAVGVETKEQLAFLGNHGCDEVQGFYFGQALPADEFAEWIAMRPQPAAASQFAS